MSEQHRHADRAPNACRRDRRSGLSGGGLSRGGLSRGGLSRGDLSRGDLSQGGMSMPGVLAIIGAGLFMGLFALRIGPSYIENMTINKIVSDKASDAELMRAPPGKIYTALNRAYEMNNLRGMKAEDSIVLTRDADRGHVMTVRYEKRASLMSNIDVVTRFEKDATP